MNNSYNYYAAPRKKKGMPSWAVVLIVALALAVIGCAVFAVMSRNPLLSVRNAVKTSLKAAGSSEPAQIVTAAAECGSVEIYADGRGITSGLIGVEINAGARVRFHFNLDDSAEAAVRASLDLNGAEAADLLLYTDGKSAAAKSEAIFGTKTYGFRFDEVREKFDGSIWGPDGAYSLATLLNLDMTGEELAEYLEPLASSGKSKDEVEKLFKSVGADILKLANKYADVKQENRESEDFGEKMKIRFVSMEIEGEKLYVFLNEALAAVRDNKRLNEYLEKHPDLFEKAGINGAEDLKNRIDEALNTLEEERDEVLKSGVQFGFAVSKSNGQLVGFDFTVYTTEDGRVRDRVVSGAFECGPDWKNPQTARFLLSADPFDTEVKGKFVTEESGRKNLQVSVNNTVVSDNWLDYDEETGAFTLSCGVGDFSFGVTGEYSRAEKDETVINLRSAAIGEESYSLGETRVTVREKDEMPVVADWEDALDMREEDAEKVAEDITEFIGTFKEKLADTIGILAYLLF